MAYTFNLNAGQLIDMSFKMMNVVSLPDSAQSGDYSYALNMLNMMIKSWSAEGVKLWKRKQAALFISYNQNKYELGSVSGSDNCALNTGYVSTTSSTMTSSGVNTITLTSVTGMNINDNIGIELDDKSRQWTTITNINTNTLVVTLNANTNTTAASGNTVITYTSKINRPLEILRATLLDLSTNTETPIEKLTYDQYFNTPIKTVNGRPVNFYYDRLLNNSLPYTGSLYVYLDPDSSKYIIKFSYYDAIQDVVNSTDTLDFPQEWALPIAANLAVLLASFGYGKLIEAQATTQMAMLLKEQLKSFDSDDEYMTLVINPTNRTIS